MSPSRSAWSAWIESDSEADEFAERIVALRMERVDRKGCTCGQKTIALNVALRMERVDRKSQPTHGCNPNDSRAPHGARGSKDGTRSCYWPYLCCRAPHGARGSKAPLNVGGALFNFVALRMERVDRKFADVTWESCKQVALRMERVDRKY